MIASAVRICAVLGVRYWVVVPPPTRRRRRRRRRRRGGRRGGGGISSSDLPGQPVPGTQEDLEVSVGDRVLFDYDSSVLDPVATQTLDRQAAWLKQYPDVIVTVEGHADERGTREYNLALGDRRASAVKNYLAALR